MKTVSGWFLLMMLVGCGARRHEPAPASTAQTAAPPIATQATAEKTPTAASIMASPSKLAAVLMPLHRPDDEQSRALQLEEILFKQPPQAGEYVTVIPLGTALEPLQSKIMSVRETADPCAESLPNRWEVELEPITQPDYVKAVFAVPGRMEGRYLPLLVCVLYPARADARPLNLGLLATAGLPTGVVLRNVRLALDLNGDETPDVLLTEYCCDAPRQARRHCDLTCGKTYLWVAGRWKEIDSYTPC